MVVVILFYCFKKEKPYFEDWETQKRLLYITKAVGIFFFSMVFASKVIKDKLDP